MYFQEEEQLPVLLPIRKKKNEVSVHEPASPTTQKKAANPESIQVFPNKQSTHSKKENVEREREREREREVRVGMGAQKIEEFDRKFREIHEISEKGKGKEGKEGERRGASKNSEIEKSKYLIGEMMRKIDARNITEELYPVTNETIGALIGKMEEEVRELREQAERKENSLSSNPNNQHLKKELGVLKSAIDRCVTITQLYNEKIHLRNKISSLERSIIVLKDENANLKIQIKRGIETISNHMHNLPCEKEKELNEQLSKAHAELKNEKEMRQQLEKNISDIVLNFKRLYDEADTARLIVTHKLKELLEKEKRIAELQANNDPEKDKSLSEKRSPQMEALEERERKMKKTHPNPNLEYLELQPTTKRAEYTPINRTPASAEFTKGRQKAREAERDRVSVSPFSMEEQIRKMRSNQAVLAKGYYK